jgi:hypothetical protein
LEGLIANPRLKTDMSTIQDGIAIKFAPSAQFHFIKPWNSPDVSTNMLTKFARDLIDLNSSIPWANKALGQDARNTIIKLAQTSPEIFDEAWAYSTGFITNCIEGTLWAIANRIYGSHWVFLQPQLLPKCPPKPLKKKFVRLPVPIPTFKTIKGTSGVFISRIGQQPDTPEQSLTASIAKAPRPYQTFITHSITTVDWLLLSRRNPSGKSIQSGNGNPY